MTKILENALRKTIHSLPEVVKPVLRPVYRQITNSALMRYLFWGRTGSWRCHEYWRNPYLPNDKPVAYLSEPSDGREDYLVEYIGKYADRDDRVLEIGCNVGRNLNKLHEYGYLKLFGVEICGEALGLMKIGYPELYCDVQTRHTAIEHFIEEVPDGYYDVVFTMAVLEHIHPDSDWIFPHIARIAKKVVITIEDELSTSWRSFRRNYREYLEIGDMVQVEENKGSSQFPGLGPNSITRVFMHTETTQYRTRHIRDCMAMKGME